MTLTEALGPKLIARIRAMPYERRMRLGAAIRAKLDAQQMTPQQQADRNVQATFARKATATNTPAANDDMYK